MHLKCSRASWELLFGWHKLHLASFRLSQMPLEVVCRLPFAACRLPLHESQHSRPSSLSKSFVLFAFFLRFFFSFLRTVLVLFVFACRVQCSESFAECNEGNERGERGGTVVLHLNYLFNLPPSAGFY